ncbi:MAG: hypothetical protein AAF993_01605 [Pseudomonadota bacterium]
MLAIVAALYDNYVTKSGEIDNYIKKNTLFYEKTPKNRLAGPAL